MYRKLSKKANAGSLQEAPSFIIITFYNSPFLSFAFGAPGGGPLDGRLGAEG